MRVFVAGGTGVIDKQAVHRAVTAARPAAVPAGAPEGLVPRYGILYGFGASTTWLTMSWRPGFTSWLGQPTQTSPSARAA